jgi:hypothetical protein
MGEYTYVGKFFFSLDTCGLLIINVHKRLSICLTINYLDFLANSPTITHPLGSSTGPTAKYRGSLRFERGPG